MATNTNGLIYYKLDANLHGYQGDITKNCGLRGEEIDGNFNFLRGNDIQNISFDEKGNICLTKYNGEVLSAKQAEDSEYDFSFNQDSGILTIITPEGKKIILEGFKTPAREILHDTTITGDGSPEKPLSVSNNIRTGRYRPAIKLIDTVKENDEIEKLPTENLSVHDRYVTKEKINRFGKLYSLSGTETINEDLKKLNSEWRVPSKKDWDELLNAIDCAKPNHSDVTSNVELGEFAGAALKSKEYWKPIENDKVLSDDVYDFSIYPVGYCGNRGKEFYGSFGESAAYWTTTVEDNHKDMFVKTFEYNSEAVKQHTWGENYYLSLRLVKNFTGDNYNDAEVINGFTNNCIHIPGTNLIWTKENIAFSHPEYDGFTPKEWDEIEDNYSIHYFINDWNGESWDKQEIKEGEGVVLYEGEHGPLHEWILKNGELIDILHENGVSADEVTKNLSEEITNRVNADYEILEQIKTLQTTIENLQNEIASLKASAITNISGVPNEISVTVTDNTAVVGFAEDAYFVAG